MKIRQLEKTFIDDLSALYEFEEARNLAWLAISYICRLNRMQYLDAKQRELSAGDEISLLQILDELKSGKPLQYILGETEFYGLTFKVNPAVLIPRPETEELVDWILNDIKSENTEPKALKILDIGTGSGCIPIAIKKNVPSANVSGMDISIGAIDTAVQNSVLNLVEVRFFLDDILHPEQTEIINNTFNLIISNPPYVTYAEKDKMHQNVVDYEPHTALFVSDDDPLKFYRAIAGFAKTHLEKAGKLYLEINESLGAETVALLSETGFINIDLRTDLRGRNRMIKAEQS